MKKLTLLEVPKHAIVKTQDGRWGVTCGHRMGDTTRRIVDFWDGGREYMPSTEKVEVLNRPDPPPH